MKILGIDWGMRRVGVAFSARTVASPYKVLEVKDQRDALEQIEQIIEDLNIEKVILGVPLDSTGNDTAQSKEIKEFGEALKKKVKAEIVFWNEAMTSKQALRGQLESGRGPKSRRDLDATSAAYILQSYLDSTYFA